MECVPCGVSCGRLPAPEEPARRLGEPVGGGGGGVHMQVLAG